MNRDGLIYTLDADTRALIEKQFHEAQDEQESEKIAEAREDVARLDGYLRARAEADAPKIARPNSDLTRRSDA